MRKYLLIASVFLIFFFSLFISSFPDRNLHFIACDIGQGDALLLTLGTMQILVDGGPDKKVLSCLSKHMPFWDKKIDIVMVTNPDYDHYGGIIDVLRNYEVGKVLRPDKDGKAQGWDTLLSEIKGRGIPETFSKSGQEIRYTDLRFDTLNPPDNLTSDGSNEYSIVGTLSYGDFDILLTGDISPEQIPYFVDQLAPVEVLKVPHHGSKNGLTEDMLVKSDPKLAIISCGKNNRYGHPHSEVIRLLGDWGVRVLRTDQDGEIEVVSDGKTWWIRQKRAFLGNNF